MNAAEGFVAIEDINPKADVHVLVIPERHIETFRDIGAFPPDAEIFLRGVEEPKCLIGTERERRPVGDRAPGARRGAVPAEIRGRPMTLAFTTELEVAIQ